MSGYGKLKSAVPGKIRRVFYAEEVDASGQDYERSVDLAIETFGDLLEKTRVIMAPYDTWSPEVVKQISVTRTFSVGTIMLTTKYPVTIRAVDAANRPHGLTMNIRMDGKDVVADELRVPYGKYVCAPTQGLTLLDARARSIVFDVSQGIVPMVVRDDVAMVRIHVLDEAGRASTHHRLNVSSEHGIVVGSGISGRPTFDVAVEPKCEVSMTVMDMNNTARKQYRDTFEVGLKDVQVRF